ncbi:hypothetical protein ACWDOP_26515 [Nocardia sp. NPDC003693]
MKERYKLSFVVSAGPEEIQAHLDQWSAAGWELVTSTVTGNGATHFFYWQRESSG